MRATIYKSTGSWYSVKAMDGGLFNARLKGVLKLDGITSTNPVAVGDEVEIQEEEQKDFVITEILDRKNYIARTSPHNKNQHHIVAANLDRAVLFCTLKNPKTSTGFIDRFLVCAEAFHIPTILVFNKTDIYKKKEWELLNEITSVYGQIGYKVLPISLENNENVEELKLWLKDKTSLLSGHSGVGKSTFINAIFPEKNLRTQEVSDWSGKGMHTTTFAEMFDLLFGGRIIDTPGIREFGLTGIERVELSHYFPEMRDVLSNCRFNNCMHIEEPGCAVRQAVADGIISPERYVSYRSILDTMDDKNY
ncbi:ribosome small subunit-dependent GTPase A [Arachidicoccus ginsenosidimutans]|uniref:ribosome small subunit-dependent GTPase A n=1 Tax=Arachidicoccus sp. BS20 TaxID=1850526 RepID=UPI0007F07E45|nr:ribosome small subunit-dependent GTPase A [Arachidicoccus sp. BS20]ANI89917.1 ribosome small subunit-dependent GTPase A [Arachidicoccus sp. BS20]